MPEPTESALTEPASPRLRERVWVTKIDHTVDPPEPVEEVFVENGRLIAVRRLRPKED